jgi:LysM repeat protein
MFSLFNFDKVKQIFRGFFKTPRLCLGVVSAVLFCLISLSSGLFIKSLSNKGDFSLAALSGTGEEQENKDLFVGSAKSFSPESTEFLLVGDSSLKSVSPPNTFSPQALGALVGGYEPEDTKKVITEYIVEEGDSLSLIAEKFGISLNTLLWANDLNKDSLLKIGREMIVLPVSGVIYHVKSGDTVSDIAQKYKGKTDEIVAFNNLSNEGDVYIGDIIIVPNGIIPAPIIKYTAPASVPLADSYFICPISSPCRITQRLHWYNAIDFSHGNCGESILAAAGGQVLKVRLTNSTSRWAFGGAGNTISILHPNGVVTSYGHVAVSLVNPGDQVSQGQIIALMGGLPGTPGAGLSTGCHLHFGVSGARNPFAK